MTMTEKRFTTVELPKPNRWGIWYDGACLSTYQVCILLNEYVDVKKENEQLKQFKNKVFNLLQDEIREESELLDYYLKEKAPYNADRQQIIIGVLKRLQKELEE